MFPAETLGAICCNISDRGSMSRRDATATACQSELSHRWQVVRLSHNRFQLRRRSRILLERRAGNQTDAQGDRSTPRRVGEAEADRAGSTCQVSGHRGDTDVQQSTGPLQPGERILVSGMLSLSVGKRVHFADRDTVNELNDWPAEDYRAARRGPWMRCAADRYRFKRRIQQTEEILCNVLTESHRNNMRALLCIE